LKLVLIINIYYTVNKNIFFFPTNVCTLRGDYMSLVDFGLLVKTLRKNSFDPSGNRWSREGLSKAVHLTEDQLGRLERGDRKYLDNQTLMLLADSFNLTSLERKEFFYAALSLKDNKLFNHHEPETQLKNVIATMETLQVPAYIIDVYADIVVVNTAVLNLYQVTRELIDYVRQLPGGLNLLYFIYSSTLGFKEVIGSYWNKTAMMALLEFRRSSLRYRHTVYFKYILKTLLKEKQFDIDWYSSHRYLDFFDLTYERFEYEHPFFGPLAYTATETIINTKAGDLYLILYNPADSITVSVFKELLKFNGNKIHQLASWPEKSTI